MAGFINHLHTELIKLTDPPDTGKVITNTSADVIEVIEWSPGVPIIPIPGDGDPRYRHESPDGTITQAMVIDRNMAEVQIALDCTPPGDMDVTHHEARIKTRLGAVKNDADAYIAAGQALSRMPQLRAHALTRGHLTFGHLRTIGSCVAAVDDNHIDHLDARITNFLTPIRDRSTIPAPKTLRKHIKLFIDDLQPLAYPVDRDDDLGPRPEGDDEDQSPARRSVTFTDDGKETDDGADTEEMVARLAPGQMAEFRAVLDAICQRQGCSRPDGLIHMARATSTVNVTLNLHRAFTDSDLAISDDGTRAWLPNAGWLSTVATDEWTQRATHIRHSSDSWMPGYRPTEAQRATVVARDGRCRFPGCDEPACRCDIDHIHPYDHDDPRSGGPTDTQNLHLLCRKHHNLKTSRLWDCTRMPDGTEIWTSCDGDTLTSFPQGPLAGHGRLTYDTKLTRRAETLRTLNLRRLGHLDSTEAERQAAENPETQSPPRPRTISWDDIGDPTMDLFEPEPDRDVVADPEAWVKILAEAAEFERQYEGWDPTEKYAE